jgi:hypothetical protein
LCWFEQAYAPDTLIQIAFELFECSVPLAAQMPLPDDVRGFDPGQYRLR